MQAGGKTFSDLEWGMLRDVGAVAEGMPVIAVGHDCRLVLQDIEPSVVDMLADVIVVPSEVIQVEKVYAKPPGILWEYVSPELRQEVPPLQELFMKQYARGEGKADDRQQD